MRIAFVADPHSPNGWYRAIGPIVALARRGHGARQIQTMDGRFRADLVNGCDVIHIHRRHDAQVQAVVQHAKRTGIAIVWDNDDDLAAIPKGNAAYRHYGGLRGERALASVRRIVASADLVTTSSTVLADGFRMMGAAQVRVVENHVRDENLLVRRGESDESILVGWVAGKEHHLDVERLPIRAVLEEILANHSGVRAVTIGVGLGIDDPRYEHVPHLRFEEMPAHIARFDVGIAPIADLRINRARSNVKLKEYAVVGVPWLASDIGPYARLGERQGGRLVNDDGWYDAIERLVIKRRERRRLAKRALKWGCTQTISLHAHEWESAFAAARERAANRSGERAVARLG